MLTELFASSASTGILSAVVGISAVIAVSAVFYVIGRGEDRDRAEEQLQTPQSEPGPAPDSSPSESPGPTPGEVSRRSRLSGSARRRRRP